MEENEVSVLHHLQAAVEDNLALKFLGSILQGRSGKVDLLYVEEVLGEIADEKRRKLAQEQQEQGQKPAPREEDTLTRVEEKVKQFLPECIVSTSSVAGDPVEEVLDQLERKSYDLLSLEAYGRGGFRKNILGAHVNKIVQESLVPTLVHKGELAACKRVLVHVPNDRGRCTRLITYLADLFRASRPTITFLVILPESQEKFEGYISGEEERLLESIDNYDREEFKYLDIAREIMAERGIKGEARGRIGQVPEEILAEAKEGRYDLMAFFPEEPNILTSLWSGDESLKTMRDIDISFLKFVGTDRY